MKEIWQYKFQTLQASSKVFDIYKNGKVHILCLLWVCIIDVLVVGLKVMCHVFSFAMASNRVFLVAFVVLCPYSVQY